MPKACGRITLNKQAGQTLKANSELCGKQYDSLSALRALEVLCYCRVIACIVDV